jgi:hypothetical protein
MTRLEWFKTLPYVIRDKAISYTTNGSLNNEVDSLHEAIIGGFEWNNTAEGYEYWCRVGSGFF